jgi:hypothetical protein
VLDFLLDIQGSTNRRVCGGDVQNEGLPLFRTQQCWQMLEVVFGIIKSLMLLCFLVYFCRATQYAEKGETFSVSFVMNMLSAAMWPVNFCTSFLVCGGYIWMIAFILQGLASIPLVETKQPNTLPMVTLKTHFSGLSLRFVSRILVKVSDRSEMYDSFFLLATMMSST